MILSFIEGVKIIVDLKTPINISVQIDKEENDLYRYFTNDELEETAKEVAYIMEHPMEYKIYDNRKNLKKALLLDD